MTDRFSQTSLAVTKVMPIALGAPAGHRVSCCLRLAASTSDQTSVIRLHSAKCKRTISRHSDVGVFEWSQTTNICSRLIAVKVRFGSMLSKKGFCGGLRATLIQDQKSMRNLDSKIRLPGFVRFIF
jgi:hypothetical protein